MVGLLATFGPRLAALLLAAPAPASSQSADLDPGLVGWAADNGFFSALPGYALSTESLSSPELIGLFEDPTMRTIYAYMTRCALPEGVTVTVPVGADTFEMSGGLGLAPEWADGPCDEGCQEWVSSCLLALTNQYGVHVGVTLAASEDVGADGVDVDSDLFVQEGAFYGNYFTDPPRLYTCRGTGYDPLLMTFRRCAQPDGLCAMNWVGACGAIDGDTGVAPTRRACDPEVDGVYRRCSNRATIDGAFPDPHREYTRTITVYLKKTSFSPCPASAPLVYEPGSAERPPLDTANTCDATASDDPLGCLGADCFNDDGCAQDDLLCNSTTNRIGVCTKGCSGGAEAVAAGECGEGATCLTQGSSLIASSQCARACTPGVLDGQPGGCRSNEVCTDLWWTHDTLTSDVPPGCFPSCHSDADCDATAYCHPRAMRCEETPDRPNGRADGEPCRLDKPDPCRGVCVSIARGDPRGLCVSLIDRRLVGCPDDPEHMTPVARDDDFVGLCINKTCKSSLDCTPPLVCLSSGGGIFAPAATCGYAP